MVPGTQHVWKLVPWNEKMVPGTNKWSPEQKKKGFIYQNMVSRTNKWFRERHNNKCFIFPIHIPVHLGNCCIFPMHIPDYWGILDIGTHTLQHRDHFLLHRDSSSATGTHNQQQIHRCFFVTGTCFWSLGLFFGSRDHFLLQGTNF